MIPMKTEEGGESMEAWREELCQLEHDGSKGMKWHVRRYRNYDGTLTPEGRERYGVGPARDAHKSMSDEELTKYTQRLNKENAYKKAFKEGFPDKKSPDPGQIKSVGNDAKQVTDRLVSIVKRKAANKRINGVDYSSMTNEELETRIKRLNLERSYREAVSGNTSKRERRLAERLDTLGDVLAIGGTALATIYMIKKIKGGSD